MFGQPQASTGFAFGPQSSASAFGTGTAPAFGAGSTPAFGTGSTPAFGASTGFGAGSTPGFGASSGAALFSTSTPAFGAASASAFGSSQPASSTTTFNFAANTGGAFGASSAPAFGASSSTTGFGQAPQPTLLGFGQQPAQQAQQQQQNVPFTRATPFNELPAHTQNQLQQIQEQISRFEADRLKVQQLPHLQEAPAHQQGLDAEIAAVRADMKELSGLIRSQKEGLQDFKEKSQQLVKAVDIIVKTYTRNRDWRKHVNGGDQTTLQQVMSMPFLLPGPYLEEAVQGMGQSVAEYSRVLDEVEQVLATSSLQDPSQVDWRTVLPTIVSNMHDYFISVAAKLEKTHSEVERLKPHYRAHLRAQGHYSDPFERVRRQEQMEQQQPQQRPSAAVAAQQQAAALQAAGGAGAALPALPAPGGMFAAQTPATPAPQATPGIGFGSPFPNAGTPFGASPFGGNQNNSGLSRSTSKPKSKKR